MAKGPITTKDAHLELILLFIALLSISFLLFITFLINIQTVISNSFDTLDEALIYVSKNPDDWFQIVDSTTGFILE